MYASWYAGSLCSCDHCGCHTSTPPKNIYIALSFAFLKVTSSYTSLTAPCCQQIYVCVGTLQTLTLVRHFETVFSTKYVSRPSCLLSHLFMCESASIYNFKKLCIGKMYRYSFKTPKVPATQHSVFICTTDFIACFTYFPWLSGSVASVTLFDPALQASCGYSLWRLVDSNGILN